MKYEISQEELTNFIYFSKFNSGDSLNDYWAEAIVYFLKKHEIKELKIEVGKFYKAINGEKLVCVFKDDEDEGSSCRMIPIGDNCHDVFWLKENGFCSELGNYVVSEWRDKNV